MNGVMYVSKYKYARCNTEWHLIFLSQHSEKCEKVSFLYPKVHITVIHDVFWCTLH